MMQFVMFTLLLVRQLNMNSRRRKTSKKRSEIVLKEGVAKYSFTKYNHHQLRLKRHDCKTENLISRRNGPSMNFNNERQIFDYMKLAYDKWALLTYDKNLNCIKAMRRQN